MKFDLTTKTIHQTHITNLELVPAADGVWEGLKRDSRIDSPSSILDEEEFEENWLTEVLKHAIELLPMYDELDGVHIYLGHWAGDGRQCAIAASEMANYGLDVTYNGWRVLVSCSETDWGLD